MVSGRHKHEFDAALAAGFDPAALPRSTSIGAALAASLRGHIVFARLRPHDPVPELSVGEAYGVSRSHTREALRLLEDQQLVRRVPQSGSYVTPISAKLVHQGGFLRMAVEEANIRQLAGRVTPAQLDALWALIDEQDDAAENSDRQRFHDLDEAFHRTLFEAGERAFAWQYLQPAKLHVDRARIATLGLAASPGRAIGEHRAILTALADNDVDAAIAAIHTHLQQIEILLQHLTTLKPTFVDTVSDALTPDQVV